MVGLVQGPAWAQSAADARPSNRSGLRGDLSDGSGQEGGTVRLGQPDNTQAGQEIASSPSSGSADTTSARDPSSGDADRKPLKFGLAKSAAKTKDRARLPHGLPTLPRREA